MTAGGPKREGPDRRKMLLWGRWVEVDRELRRGTPTDKPLVPRSWQLIRRAPNGDEQTIASGVVAFDLCDDGGLIHTDGMSVFYRAPGAGEGADERLARGRFIERVCAISA
jgi:hypothetical protein